jgi:hypothetical protein
MVSKIDHRPQATKKIFKERKGDLIMTNTNKMTKKDFFKLLAGIVEKTEDFDKKTETLDFINHEIELLNKKSSAPGKKKTAHIKENEELMELIEIALELFGKPVTVTTMIKENAEMSKLSSQKLSALLKKMIEAGKVVRTVEKRVPYFSLAKEEEEETEKEE